VRIEGRGRIVVPEAIAIADPVGTIAHPAGTIDRGRIAHVTTDHSSHATAPLVLKVRLIAARVEKTAATAVVAGRIVAPERNAGERPRRSTPTKRRRSRRRGARSQQSEPSSKPRKLRPRRSPPVARSSRS
jgi:hypothetical protein